MKNSTLPCQRADKTLQMQRFASGEDLDEMGEGRGQGAKGDKGGNRGSKRQSGRNWVGLSQCLRGTVSEETQDPGQVSI